MNSTHASSPWLGLGHLHRLRTDQLGFYQSMHARHGDAVRIRLGPYRNWLLFHPDAIEAVLATHASQFIRFEPVMRVLAQWNGASLLIAEGERWRTRRRQVLPAFASRRLPGYGDRVVARTTLLRDELAASGAALDTDRAMVALTLDLAAETLFGRHLADPARIGEAVAILSEVAFRESTSPLRLPAWWPGQGRKRRAMATMDALVRDIVHARLAGPPTDRGDLLSMLTASADAPAIRDEVMTLLIAGHETTGATLSWASHLLGAHPATLSALQAELAALGDRALTAADLPALPLLRAVLDETLRLYPPAYTLFPRRAVADVSVGDALVRQGDLVQLVPWVTHRDPRWFADPAAFRPERFLAAPAWPRYAYLPFGAGPRVCIGQAFGLMEMALALGTLLQRLSPGPARTPVVAEPRFSLRPAGGLWQSWQAHVPAHG